MAASSAMPSGTWRGSSSSRITGLTNNTLAMAIPQNLHGPGGRAGGRGRRQVVGVQAWQLERTGEIAGQIHACREPKGAAALPQEIERRRVVAAEWVAHDPIHGRPAVNSREEIDCRVDLGDLSRRCQRIEPYVRG